MARTEMTRISTGRNLLRLAVVGAVAVGAPLALAGTASAAPESAWDKLAQCESGGNWNINTGNGYSGGMQFNAVDLARIRRQGHAAQASGPQQIAVAERILAAQGWGAWPSCSSKMGLRGTRRRRPGKTAAPTGEEARRPRAGQARAGERPGGNYTGQARRHPRQDRQARTAMAVRRYGAIGDSRQRTGGRELARTRAQGRRCASLTFRSEFRPASRGTPAQVELTHSSEPSENTWCFHTGSAA